MRPIVPALVRGRGRVGVGVGVRVRVTGGVRLMVRVSLQRLELPAHRPN